MAEVQTSLATGEQKHSHCHVPLVLIGVTRHTALATSSALQALDRPNYPVVACLDSTESPPEYQFIAHNLGVVLWTLYPRPKALVTGTAVSDEVLEEVRGVWEDYVREAIEKEGLGGHCWVQLSKWHATTGPPPEGWDREIVRHLDAVFL